MQVNTIAALLKYTVEQCFESKVVNNYHSCHLEFKPGDLLH